MRSALAISASSLLIIVALSPEGEFRWWITVLGLACIWLLRVVAEQERRDEHDQIKRGVIADAITFLEASDADAQGLPREQHRSE